MNQAVKEPDDGQERRSDCLKSETLLVSGRSFIFRLWAGDIPLPITYWVFYVLLGALFGVAVKTYFEQFGVSAELSGYGDVKYVIIGILVILHVFIVVCVWRSANNYRKIHKRVWGTVAQVAVVSGTLFSIGKVALDLYFSQPQDIIYGQNRLNASLPEMIDNITRLDAIQYEGGHIIYNYTIAVSSDSGLKDRIKATVTSSTCEAPASRKLLNKFDLIFIYRSTDGAPLARVVVKNDDCLNE